MFYMRSVQRSSIPGKGTMSRPALRHIQPIQGEPGALFLRVKRPVCEAAYSSLCSTKITYALSSMELVRGSIQPCMWLKTKDLKRKYYTVLCVWGMNSADK